MTEKLNNTERTIIEQALMAADKYLLTKGKSNVAHDHLRNLRTACRVMLAALS